ncbi:DUF4282 domain-containing protein [Angustibacter luteus]|uniref:DUF4282 domain-containing protein n=1 Tax=Angustibacter luteus TaxID=658456 RepID=A0ABW1J9M8_9ACTN
MTTQSNLQAKGFLATLFDFSFTSFLTLRFLKVIYTVLVVLVLLGGLSIFIAFASRGVGGFIAGLVLAPLLALVYLVIARISLEVVALFFRIGENTSVMARAALADGVVAPASPYGQPPVAPPTSSTEPTSPITSTEPTEPPFPPSTTDPLG